MVVLPVGADGPVAHDALEPGGRETSLIQPFLCQIVVIDLPLDDSVLVRAGVFYLLAEAVDDGQILVEGGPQVHQQRGDAPALRRPL